MKKFNVKPLGAIISGLIMAAASQAVLAQNAGQDEPVVEEITVTGFAKSIATAIEVKRQADTVVEAISAEDIGGLPDKSIADSLSRLPGITVTRKGGQAGTVQVRGMGEGYVLSTMNGREQVSPNGSRAMEYSQFPSELISSVEVYKSPKASLLEGGTAGTVELKTVSPLDLKEERQFTVGLRGTYNDEAGDLYEADAKGHRISLSYQQKLLDDSLGFSLGYAQLKEPRAQMQIDVSSYDSRVTENNTWTTTNIKVLQDSGVTQRDGYMAAIEFDPADEIKIQADAFYSKFKIDSTTRGIWATNINNTLRSDVTYFGPVETGANLSNEAPTGGFGIRTVNDNKDNENKLFSSGVNFQWAHEALTVSVDLSHSAASGYEVNGNGIIEQYDANPDVDGGYALNTGTQQMHYQLDGINVPSIAVNSPGLTDITKLRVTSQSSYPYANEDKIDAIRLDVKYEVDLPLLSSVEAGVRRSKRNHIETREVNRYGNGGISTDYSLEVTDANADLVNWKGAFSNMPSFYAVDSDAILAAAYARGDVLMSATAPNAYDENGNIRPRSSSLAWRWGNGSITQGEGGPTPDSDTKWSLQQAADIDENVDSIYFQANIATTVADRDLTGNLGVRHIRSEQSNYSLADLNGDTTKGAMEICDVDGICLTRYGYTRVGTSYSNTLPSLNLKYQVTDIDQVRLALARVMTRAPIRQLASFTFGSVDVVGQVATYKYGEGKSPLLKPFLADQIDLSYEHYLEETNGSITVAGYYRDIKSFIQTQTLSRYDFVGNGVGDKPATYIIKNETTNGLALEVPVLDGTYTFATNNQEGGYIKGIEIAYTQTFTFLPSYLSGLGFSGSASFTDSEISQPRTGNAVYSSEKMDFPGLVKESYNFTLFYTYEGFETRLSTTFQDAFVGESRTVGPDIIPVSYAAETVLDYQMKYKTENGLDLIFSVGNLTNEPNRSYMIDEALPLKLNWFGRTYSLGANYTF